MAIKVLECKDEQLVLDLLGQVPLIHEGNQVAIPGECFNDIALRLGLAIENESLRTQELLNEIKRVVGKPSPGLCTFRAKLMWAITQLPKGNCQC